MPLVPEFNSGGNPAPASLAVEQGINLGESMMDRAQARKLRAAQEARAQENYDLELPLRQAQAKLGVAEATNAFAGAQQMSGLVEKANLEMPTLRQQWKDTYGITDEDKRLTAQEQLLANASRYSSLKGLGEEVKQWHDTWAQQLVQKKARDMVTGRLEQAAMKAEADKQIAETKAQAAKEIAEAKAQAAEQLAKERHERQLEAIKFTKEKDSENSSRKVRNEGAYKVNTERTEAGRVAQQEIVSMKRGLELLDDPEVRTGTGANAEIKLRRLGQIFGVDTGATAKPEELQRILGDAILARVNQTKGAISDKEMALFDSYSASLGKSPEGNKAILTALLRAKERQVQIAKMTNDLRRKGEDEFDIQTKIDDYILSNNIWDGLDVPGHEDKKSAATEGSWTQEKEERLNRLKAKLEGK